MGDSSLRGLDRHVKFQEIGPHPLGSSSLSLFPSSPSDTPVDLFLRSSAIAIHFSLLLLLHFDLCVSVCDSTFCFKPPPPPPLRFVIHEKERENQKIKKKIEKKKKKKKKKK